MMEDRIPDVPSPAFILDLAAEILAGVCDDITNGAEYISAYLGDQEGDTGLRLAALIHLKRKEA